MSMQTKRPLYRPYERFYGIGILAVLSLSLLTYVPNDIRYITDNLIFSIVVCIRGFFISLALVTWYLTKRNIAEQTYNRLVMLLLITAGLMAFFIEGTRPRDFLVSCMPNLMFITYCFFILPAPFRIKLSAGLVMSATEILFLLFWKTSQGGERQVLVTSIITLDLIGIFNVFETGRLKLTEQTYFQNDEEIVRFRQALSGDADLAVVVHHEDSVIDYNRKFAEFAGQCGVSEKYIGHIRLSSFIFIGEDVAESFKRGDIVPACVAGILGSIPVEVRRRYFYVGNQMYLATVIREKSPEPIDNDKTTDIDQIEKNIQVLPITARDKEIVRAITQKKTAIRIADEFCISDASLKRKTLAIYRKLGVSTANGLMKIILSNAASPEDHAP